MWVGHLLLTACCAWAGQTAPTPTSKAGLGGDCSTVAVSGRRVDSDAAGAAVLDQVSGATADGCVQLCCARAACSVAVLEGGSCRLLRCPQQGACRLVPAEQDSEQQVWRVTRDSTSSSPASAVTASAPSDRAPIPATVGSRRPCQPNVSAACPPSQHCAPLAGRPDAGFCRCPDGLSLAAGDLCRPPDGHGLEVAATGPPPPPASATRAPLLVAVRNQTIILPNNSATLWADVRPRPPPGEQYRYEWQLLPRGAASAASSGEATISDRSRQLVRLEGLSEGVYVFRLRVDAPQAYGETFANVTVLSAPRVNQRPVAAVSPANQTLRLPNSKALLDGSTSTDDQPDSLTYRWEVVQAPLDFQQELDSSPTLQLENLTPGNYTIRLTVEDSDHATDSAEAHITVLKEVDYAPQANAGEDVIVYLPNNAVMLYGNASTDDKGIVSYEWTKAPGSEDKAVDMQDTHTPFLRLANLEEGVYTFLLKVTDSADHSSTDSAVVVVKAQANTPPKAVAGKNQTLTLPRTWAILDGSASRDDLRVVSWLWEQISGPPGARIVNATQPVANATALTRGVYTFRLTVRDDASNSTALTNVTVVQATNRPPVADAGGDLTLHLPFSVVTLNGSRSSDDVGIVSWRWTRDGSSLAAGRVVGDSDSASSLQLVDMVAGLYRFHLTVADEQGATAQDTVAVVIQEDPNINSQVSIELDFPFSEWTEAQKEALAKKVALLLPSSGDVRVRLQRWEQEPRTGHLLLRLTASVTTLGDDAKPKEKAIPGPSVVAALRTRLRSDPSALDHPVLLVQTVVCQNTCSGHGRCQPSTRACLCDRFWTENVFRRLAADGEANCDWSVLYVIIISFSLTVAAGVAGWAAVCLVRRWLSRTPRDWRRRYAPVGQPDSLQMLPKDSQSASSMMASETDSESEPLFEATGRRRTRNNNKRRKRNGLLRPVKNGKKM